MHTTKSHITLKYKDIDDGKKSIYLDYYKDGKRIREAIHLYLLPETSKKNISTNKQTMKEAEVIRAAKENELLTASFGIEVKEPSTQCIGEAIDEYEKIILGKGRQFFRYQYQRNEKGCGSLPWIENKGY